MLLNKFNIFLIMENYVHHFLFYQVSHFSKELKYNCTEINIAERKILYGN